MCISSRIKKYLAEKEALDARIAKLEQLEIKTAPVKILLVELLSGYFEEAPEELPEVWQEILAIGQKFDLTARPIDISDIREAVDERDVLEKELAELRSQLPTPTIHAKYELATGNDASELSEVQCQQQLEAWSKDAITLELEKLSQEAQAETDSIPALTLWQPWATLIARGDKKIETRSWATTYRGLLAIHAAKRPVDWSTLNEDEYAMPEDKDWPLGAVVAIANLVDCIEMSPEFIAAQTPQERALGVWQPGRFAWVFENVRPVNPPISATGGQKLWQWSIPAVQKYELEEATDTVQSVFEANGFFLQSDAEHYWDWDTSELYENYLGWDIFYSFPNGGIVAIGLKNAENNQFWNGDTEHIQEIEGNTFPESLADYDKIVVWTKQLIDRVVDITPVESGVITGQIADTKTVDDEYETILITFDEQQWLVQQITPLEEDGMTIFIQTKSRDEGFTETVTRKDVENNDHSLAKCAKQVLNKRSLDYLTQNRSFNQIFELQDFKVDVRQHNKGDEFAGASFNFYKIREDGAIINQEKTALTLSRSLTAAECAGKHPKELATEIIEAYWQKLRETKEKETNPYKKPEDDFIEFVRLTPAVGYIKRRDTGELISAYAAFANRDAAGEKTATLAKPRAKKWADFLHSSFQSCGWKIAEPRKVKRMESEPGAKQRFAYEIKITGKFSIAQLQKLAEEDFSLMPNEIAVKPAEPVIASELTYKVKINSFEVASGTEKEMQQRFDEELKTLGAEGRTNMRLVCGNQVIEDYGLTDFVFVPAQDFDEGNPEYFTVYKPTKTNFRVYRSLASDPDWINSIYPYSPNFFATKEAAAADAVRRQLKAQKPE